MSRNIFIILCFISILLIISGITTFAQNIANINEIEKNAELLRKEWNGESIHHSISLYQEASNDWLKNNQPDKATNSLREIVKLYSLLSDSNKALNTLNSAKLIDAKKNNLFGKIENLILEFQIELNLGNVKKSDALYLQIQKLSKSAFDKTNQISILFAIGTQFLSKNKFKKSSEIYEQALDIASDIKSEVWQAKLYYQLGLVNLITKDYSLAKFNATSSKTIYESLKDVQGIVVNLILIGEIESFEGNKQNALKYFNEAEQLFPNDIAFFERANLLNFFAFVFESYNELKLSLEYRKKALDYFIKASHSEGQLTTLLRISELCLLLNDKESMFFYLTKAETIAKNLNDIFFLAIIKSVYGNYYFSIQNFEKAQVYYEQSITILDKEIYKSDVSLISIKLGEISLQKNDFEKTRKYFQNALVLNNESHNKMATAQTLYYFTKLNLLENNHYEAFHNITDSIKLTESFYSDVINSNLKRTYFSNVFDRYELYINLLMKMQKQSPNESYAIEALQASEKSRARSMLENLALSGANFTKDAEPEQVKREKEIRTVLNLKSDKLTDALSNNPIDKAEVDKLDGEINELNYQLDEIKATLKQNSPIYSTVKNPAPFDVGEFQKNILDDNSLLLEFSFGKDESYLWCVGKNDVNSFTLPAREKLEERVQKLLELMSNRAMKTDESIENYQARINEADNNYCREAQILSNELFGQISDKIGGKRLIIVADGKLHLFPISALPLPNSNKNEPLLLTNEVVYEPSALTLNLIKTSPISKNPPNKNLLVFADPVFLKDDERLSNIEKPAANSNTDLAVAPTPNLRFAESLNQLQRLYGSEEEAQTITKIADSSKSEILSGFSATREKLFTPEILDYKILHFATHGSINRERPELSSIVLSQYNQQGQPLEGLVKLQDIYSLNLSTDLVVLSACETGIGKEVKGEGLMSLNNAFLQVGAKSVLSSLWKVDDNATKELMKNFYQEMATEKFTTSEALRQAQIKMWNNPQFKSPFYWAAFTVQGDYQNTPKLSSGLSYSVYCLIGIVILLIGTYAGYRINLLRKNK